MVDHVLLQYLKLIRELAGYGEVVFPHCGCDSRKEGHVITCIGFSSLKLVACKQDGTPEVIIPPSNYFYFVRKHYLL